MTLWKGCVSWLLQVPLFLCLFHSKNIKYFVPLSMKWVIKVSRLKIVKKSLLTSLCISKGWKHETFATQNQRITKMIEALFYQMIVAYVKNNCRKNTFLSLWHFELSWENVLSQRIVSTTHMRGGSCYNQFSF